MLRAAEPAEPPLRFFLKVGYLARARVEKQLENAVSSVPHCLLQRHAGDSVEEHQIVLFLLGGEHGTSFEIGDRLALSLPGRPQGTAIVQAADFPSALAAPAPVRLCMA